MPDESELDTRYFLDNSREISPHLIIVRKRDLAPSHSLAPEFVQHDLRHRRVTKWLAEEKSAVLVREAVGHADLRTTMAYTHLAREHLRGLVDGEPKQHERDERRDLA